MIQCYVLALVILAFKLSSFCIPIIIVFLKIMYSFAIDLLSSNKLMEIHYNVYC